MIIKILIFQARASENIIISDQGSPTSSDLSETADVTESKVTNRTNYSKLIFLLVFLWTLS